MYKKVYTTFCNYISENQILHLHQRNTIYNGMFLIIIEIKIQVNL